MKIIRDKAELRKLVRDWHRTGERIGVVPTMGALHAGHLSLVDAANGRAERVIVTLFVNPKQFNNPEDLDKYPRTEEDDAKKLAPYGIDVLYVPGPEQMYPDGFSTNISVAGVSEGLCGAARPGHFDGVATVVTKLLLQTGADFAFFGEKDYQQLQVVKRLVADLDIDVEIIGCPTVREKDGLAMSSRNLRLGDGARAEAPVLQEEMQRAADAIAGGTPAAEAMAALRSALEAAGFGEVDYAEVRRDGDLALVEGQPDSAARVFVAVWLDGVRLIDNVEIGDLRSLAAE
ncbi:pantoate--beta-alanine ligase [Pseudooceanicola nanhaiensis]|uniref:pantoate--beta-alanine ligase n=1 Tax=Pseudooceanicola nanhaiensis TaxID=375761 RepID=UPI001CD59744|nr:pantoate--beta-alanine ligase [Pseudooceanicola nanhaiensis]MCA0921554.1 pantoate--beta-alanine ligase [Pseudooceanicola nanhaiensis]